MLKRKLVTKDEIPLLNIGFRTLLNDRRLFSLFIVQLLLVTVFIYNFYKIIEPAIEADALVFAQEFSYYLIACLTLFTIVIINAVLMKRRSELYNLQKNAAKHIKETAKRKISLQKDNPYGLAMLTIELAYIIGIAIAIYYYLDPEHSIDWWTRLGLDLKPPITTIANIVIFAIFTGLFIWLHTYARQFNAMRFKGRAALRKKSKLK
jgi:lysylphosphatidylglycerol synthetase-like protein (DUF2156 family)